MLSGSLPRRRGYVGSSALPSALPRAVAGVSGGSGNGNFDNWTRRWLCQTPVFPGKELDSLAAEVIDLLCRDFRHWSVDAVQVVELWKRLLALVLAAWRDRDHVGPRLR